MFRSQPPKLMAVPKKWISMLLVDYMLSLSEKSLVQHAKPSPTCEAQTSADSTIDFHHISTAVTSSLTVGGGNSG